MTLPFFIFCIKKHPQLLLGVFSGIMSWRWLTLTWVTPHYHQREEVSLLSSGRDQVVHSCYCRQHNCLWILALVLFEERCSLGHCFFQILNRLGCLSWILSSVWLTKSSYIWVLSEVIQLFGCCIVKPHE